MHSAVNLVKRQATFAGNQYADLSENGCLHWWHYQTLNRLMRLPTRRQMLQALDPGLWAPVLLALIS